MPGTKVLSETETLHFQNHWILVRKAERLVLIGVGSRGAESGARVQP